jgi:PIN domain nuclease of toxin-antitoxin system
LEELAKRVDTLGISPAIAETGASLPNSFSHDPADRIIYATAIEHGLRLVTKDEDMRAHKQASTIW